MIIIEDSLKSIVLIGMPGSGKTTIGKILSKELSKNFIDMDEYIEKKYNASISELFKNGEDYFRMLESRVALEIGKESNTVIATGGGIIKNLDNIKSLSKNGIIVFIDRPVEQILSDVDIKKRPLLKDGVNKVYQLFNERYEAYKRSCDIEIRNSGTIAETVDKIMECINR